MSIIGDLNEEIYIATDGKLGINGQGKEKSTVIKDISKSAGMYCANPAKDENNTVYDNYERAHKITAVTSIVMADYATHMQRNMYEKFVQNPEAQNYLSSIGYGNSAQNAASNMLSKGFVGNQLETVVETTANNKTPDSYASDIINRVNEKVSGNKTTFAPITADASSLTRAERSSLMATGQFTRTVDGRNVIFKVNDTNTNTVMKTLRAADAEIQRNHRVLSAHGAKNQVAVMQELRSASLSQLRQEGIDIGKGTSRELNKVMTNLIIARDNAIKAGNTATVTSLNAKIAKVDAHNKWFGGSEKADSKWASNQRMGVRMISRGVMGNDFHQGVETYKRVGKVTTMSVKTAARATDWVAYKMGDLVTKAIPKTAADNVVVSKINKVHEKHGEARTRAKEKARAKKNGTYKDFKKSERQRRLDRKQERIEKKDAKFDSKQTELRNKGKTEKADKRQQKRDKKKERQGRVAASKDKWNGRFGKFREWKGKAKDFLTNNPLMKLLKKPLDAIGVVKSFIKKVLVQYIVFPVGIALIVLVLFFGILDVLTYGLFFISEDIQTDLHGALDNVNYVQIIVDDIAERLGEGFLDVAKKDAERHFLTIDEGAIPSDGLSWYKSPTDGEIRNIVSSEDGQDVGGVNANLLPIISAMHYRYYDDIDYEHWLTARGYSYYLYVATHDILGYDYEEADDCDSNALYASVVDCDDIWDVDTRTVTRPTDELCSNLYIHGYDVNLNRQLNEFRIASTNALNLAFSYLGIPEFNTSCYGLFNEIPHDAAGQCDNYIAVQAGKREGRNPDDDDTDNKCGHTEHIHNASCYTLTCTKAEHTHNSSCRGESRCGGCYKRLSECTCDWTGYTIPGDNCSREEHTHAAGPADGYQCYTDGDYNSCWTLTCGKEAHQHTPWQSASEPGCWKTKYICLGHCGGHIIPQIDVKVDMTFENIVSEDYFKTVYFLGESDFSESWLDSVFELNSITDWKNYWDTKMAGWFFPFPSSPSSAIENYVRWVVSNTTSSIDRLTGSIAGLFIGGGGNSVEVSIEEDAGDDIFGFDGWYKDDGTLDESIISDLESFYGTYETEYEDGVAAWEDFNVTFPAGTCRPMTSSQMSSVRDQLSASYPTLSENRKAVIDQAMEYVGEFWYDLSTRTGNANSTSGRIDCSGFVSSVLRHALGWPNDWTASGFACAGSQYNGSPTSLTPGDIVAKNRTSSWNGSWTGGGSNHVVIYIGYLPEGVPGYPDANEAGYYIIDCSSTFGGSTIRKVDAGFFAGYPYVYRGCY